MLEISVFVKADCPTCAVAVPALEGALSDLPASLTVISQSDPAATAEFLGRCGAATPSEQVQYDRDLLRSRELDFESVPAVFVGDDAEPMIGWDREAIVRALRSAGLELPGDAMTDAPAFRPGCASAHLTPEWQAQRRVAAEEHRLSAARVDVSPLADVHDFIVQAGWSDGLPVVPPTRVRVLQMLDGTTRDPGEVVGVAPPSLHEVTVEKVAINAVMAGCMPDYLPVVLAAVEGACDERFNVHAQLATTHAVGPLVVVNGPVRGVIGMNSELNVLGQGNRANMSIGRAVQLVIRNVGGGRPGEIDRSTFGQPGKLGFCIAENEEANPWGSLSQQFGCTADESAVTLFAAEAPRMLYDHNSRTPESLAWSLGAALESVAHPKVRYSPVPTNLPVFGAMLVLSPEHAKTFAEAGWTREQVRDAIQEAASRPSEQVVRDDVCQEGLTDEAVGDFEGRIPKLPPNGEHGPWLVVAGGGAGKFTAVVGGWRIPPLGCDVVTKRVRD